MTIIATQTFTKQIKMYFKYHRQFISNVSELSRTFADIQKQVNTSSSFESANEYTSTLNLNGINPNIFKKYKIFETEGLHVIFVVCSECKGSLRCSKECSINDDAKVCLYDVWVE